MLASEKGSKSYPSEDRVSGGGNKCKVISQVQMESASGETNAEK